MTFNPVRDALNEMGKKVILVDKNKLEFVVSYLKSIQNPLEPDEKLEEIISYLESL